MGLAISIIFFGFTLVTLAIAGYFATAAAVKVTKIDNWDNNDKLRSAHRNLTWAAVITWITIALILVGAILYFIYGLETAAETGKYVAWGLLALSLIAVIFVGILSAIAASDINTSGVSDKKSADRDAVIAAILGIVGSVLIITVLLISVFYKPKKKESKDPYGLYKELGEDPGDDFFA